MALHDDGRCYFLGDRGPCGEDSELRLDERTKMPSCQPVVKVGILCNVLKLMSFCDVDDLTELRLQVRTPYHTRHQGTKK